ncbi:MAG: aldehyde dehydrogenase family protein [Burkholderiaceae bacterium]|jgi:aldehyde dehydrogenase (NAD+)|nr:aldehyde dehydrogenase family protein [Burkholderiales bacterium]MCZ8104107.1 aldehyde dehydrogenase family protein [Burkholderiales bacterium]MCZ8340878.1 aldehyde dehydrogenase family protein [Burkholderiaceae bacterium]
MKQMYIGGRWIGARDERTIPVVSPADGEAFERVPRGGAHEVDLAVAAARAALDGPWGRVTATERGRVLVRIGEAVLANEDELARLEARDTGKPMATARNDIRVLARYFEFYGTAADKVHGETIPFLAGHQVSLVREPLGVTAHIIPWNYPAQMLGRTVAPALAMGNAAVLKPAEDTPLSALRVAELAAAAGLPEGAFNVVTGLGEEAGAALAAHPGIDFVSFTGSNEVGTLVQQAAAKNAVKCVLELGGKSPQIVFDDVDVERAVPIVVRAIVQNAGQTCTAGSRLLVQRSIHDAFVARVAEAFAKVRVGTPEMDLDCGPVMNPAQQRRVQRYVDGAKAAGIPVIAQGRIADGVPPGGYWVTPTLFGPVPRDAAIAREEVFGPVLAAMSFEDEADAIRLANGTDYGLLAAVWTGNSGRLHRVAKAVRAGQVFMNCYGAGGGVELPFGGTKRSGHGREKGLLALEELSTTKTLVHWHG